MPKTADGTVEMIRQIKIAKDTAVKARSQAIITFKTILVNTPAELREELEPLNDRELLERVPRSLRYESWTPPPTRPATRCARWLSVTAPSTTRSGSTSASSRPSPTARLPRSPAGSASPRTPPPSCCIVAGDNPERIRSEAALAKLCGACPIPASSGKTTRHRLNRGGHRQANAALHRILIVRMRFHEPTIAYVTRRTAEGKTKKEIMRCLKRLLIREIYQIIVAPHKNT